jgi:hypothetical protein
MLTYLNLVNVRQLINFNLIFNVSWTKRWRWECRSQYYDEGIQHFSTYRIYSWTQRWALRMSLTILWRGHSAFLNLPYLQLNSTLGVENVAHNIMTRAFSISQLTVSTVELNVGRWECRSQYYDEGIQHFSTYHIYSWTQRWALRMSLTILWRGHSAILNLPYLLYSWTKRWALRMSPTILWRGHSATLNLTYLQYSTCHLLDSSTAASNIQSRPPICIPGL